MELRPEMFVLQVHRCTCGRGCEGMLADERGRSVAAPRA